jgi:hypothetical protein
MKIVLILTHLVNPIQNTSNKFILYPDLLVTFEVTAVTAVTAVGGWQEAAIADYKYTVP